MNHDERERRTERGDEGVIRGSAGEARRTADTAAGGLESVPAQRQEQLNRRQEAVRHKRRPGPALDDTPDESGPGGNESTVAPDNAPPTDADDSQMA